VELLVGLFISGVVLVAAVRALLALTASDRDAQVELNRKDDIGRVLALMQDEIRNAQRVESGSVAAPLPALDSSRCPTSGVKTILVLRGATSNEDLSYGLLNQSDSSWRGPSVLMRCGPTYGGDGSLDAGTAAAPLRSEQIVLDALQQGNTEATSGFAATTPGGSGTISRNVELTLRSNISGVSPAIVQVPINSNQVYGLASSGITACANGTSLASGCLDPNGESRHFKPALGGSDISGSTSLEDVFYFDGNVSAYDLQETPGGGTCTQTKCTVRLKPNANGAANTPSITFTDGDVLVFKDVEIRL
jgi:hypothetical protein